MPSALDLWLTAAIGFLGSFGHCVGMCGPISAAFALSFSDTEETESGQSEEYKRPHRAEEENLAEEKKLAEENIKAGRTEKENSWHAKALRFFSRDALRAQLTFHLLLNLGRLISYGLVGAGIGAIGSVLVAGGQMAGIGSVFRRSLSIVMGLLLIWFGFTQARPGFLPTLPLLHPARQQTLHERISGAMANVSNRSYALTPLLLGLLWGLIPCGFLYTGQLRAVATQSWIGGGAVMLAFGLGTLPAMVAMGLATSALSQDRRSQLFRLGGWITVTIGVLLLVRTGDTMRDYSGHAALFCLIAALIARPISRLWSAPLRYRRVLGVAAFVLSGLHLLHMFSHTWQWQWRAVQFMLPVHQVGVVLGAIAFFLMLPAAFTSFDTAQRNLGTRWRKLHLLSAPALLLAAIHTMMIGSHYWGALALTWKNQTYVGGLALVVVIVFGLRSPHLWSLFSQQQHYAPPKSSSLTARPSDGCHAPLPIPPASDTST